MNHDGPLSPDVAAARDSYHAECLEFESGEARRDEMVEAFVNASQLDATTIGEMRKRAREVGKAMLIQYAAVVALVWRRKKLVASMLTDAKQSVSDRTKELEALIEKKTTPELINGMPAGPSDLGRHQCKMMLLANDLDVIAAKGRLNVAEDELQAIKSGMVVPPTLSDCNIEPPSTGVALADVIISEEIPPITEPELSHVAQCVRTLVGLSGAPLLAEDVKVLELVVKALGKKPGGDSFVTKFTGLTPAVAANVVPLLKCLPQTIERDRAIADCTDCQKETDDRIVASSTTYSGDRSATRETLEAVA